MGQKIHTNEIRSWHCVVLIKSLISRSFCSYNQNKTYTDDVYIQFNDAYRMHMTHDSKTQRLSDRRTQSCHIHISYFSHRPRRNWKSIQVEWYHLNLKSTFSQPIEDWARHMSAFGTHFNLVECVSESWELLLIESNRNVSRFSLQT